MFIDTRSIKPKVRAHKAWHVAKRAGFGGFVLVDGCNYKQQGDQEVPISENKRKYLDRMQKRGYNVVGFRDKSGCYNMILEKKMNSYYGDYVGLGNVSNTDVKTDYLYNRRIPPTKFLRPCKGGWSKIPRKGKVGRVHRNSQTLDEEY